MVTVEFRRLNLPPAARVLDIGCGSGRHTSAAYELPDALAIGVDRSHPDLIQARKRLRWHLYMGAHGGGTWALSAADATALPFGEASFDLVICSEVLEHVPAHETAVREAVRVLKPGAAMVVSVPRAWPERICWRLSPAYTQTSGGHIRIYRRERLQAMLEGAGLVPFGRHYAHSLHTPYWWLRCLVGPQREDQPVVKIYHRLLTWDVMKKPPLTRLLDRLGNPLWGKSMVLYLRKPA